MNAVEAVGERRRYVFENVANGIPLTDIMASFSLSEKEVKDDAMFVVSKIREYRFRRCTEGSPFARAVLQIDDIADIIANKRNLFETLDLIGNLTLGSSLVLPKITVQKVDEHTIRDVSERLEEA